MKLSGQLFVILSAADAFILQRRTFHKQALMQMLGLTTNNNNDNNNNNNIVVDAGGGSGSSSSSAAGGDNGANSGGGNDSNGGTQIVNEYQSNPYQAGYSGANNGAYGAAQQNQYQYGGYYGCYPGNPACNPYYRPYSQCYPGSPDPACAYQGYPGSVCYEGSPDPACKPHAPSEPASTPPTKEQAPPNLTAAPYPGSSTDATVNPSSSNAMPSQPALSGGDLTSNIGSMQQTSSSEAQPNLSPAESISGPQQSGSLGPNASAGAAIQSAAGTTFGKSDTPASGSNQASAMPQGPSTGGFPEAPSIPGLGSDKSPSGSMYHGASTGAGSAGSKAAPEESMHNGSSPGSASQPRPAYTRAGSGSRSYSAGSTRSEMPEDAASHDTPHSHSDGSEPHSH